MTPSTFILYVRKIRGTGWGRIKLYRGLKTEVDTEDWRGIAEETVLSFLEKKAAK